MIRPPRLRSLLAPILAPAALSLAVLACSRGEMPEAEAPAAGAVPTPEEQALAIAADPRLLLFDIQTALEGVREAQGAYPTTVEFQVEDRFELQRAALGAAFSSWQYVSDGATYQLTAEADGRQLGIASP